jgi:uncharacterized cupredoxin-like copper-binding protein
MNGRYQTLALLLGFALIAASCTVGASRSTGTDSALAAGEGVAVTPDYEAETTVVNVLLTDTGIEPSTIFLPAGRPIRLVLRNRGTREHHFRVGGIVPAQLAWLVFPDFDAYDVASMSPDELSAAGLDGDIDDLEHTLHHMIPTFVPFKEESPAGIRPIPNEVHGYATLGGADVLSFIALNTGAFVAEDVRFPEFTARVIVFEPDA